MVYGFRDCDENKSIIIDATVAVSFAVSGAWEND